MVDVYQVRKELAVQYISGEGIEVGALHARCYCGCDVRTFCPSPDRMHGIERCRLWSGDAALDVPLFGLNRDI